MNGKTENLQRKIIEANDKQGKDKKKWIIREQNNNKNSNNN